MAAVFKLARLQVARVLLDHALRILVFAQPNELRVPEMI